MIWLLVSVLEVYHCIHLNGCNCIFCVDGNLAAAIYTSTYTTPAIVAGTGGSFTTIVAAVSTVVGGIILLLVTIAIILIVGISVMGKKKTRWAIASKKAHAMVTLIRIFTHS